MDSKGVKYQLPPPYPDPDNLGYEPLAQPPPVYVVAPMIFGSYSQQCFCPNCRNSVYTNVVPKSGMGTWLAAGGICITGLWCGCQLIPFCVESCKDKEHYCPNCNAFLGVRKLI